MALFIYGTATNTGKGFFTAEDRRAFFLRGFPGDVWVVGNNEKGALWLAEKNGVEKTKAEAQAIVDAEVQKHKPLGTRYQKNKKITELIIKDLLQSHYHKEFTQGRTTVISEVTESNT